MIYIAIAAGLAALGAVSTFAGIALSAKNAQLALNEQLVKERELLSKVRGELSLETAAHAVTRTELAEAKDRLAVAESQRNQAQKREREYVAKLLVESGIADAARIGNELLSEPLPDLRDIDANDTNLERP